jgi:hypothetical protein
VLQYQQLAVVAVLAVLTCQCNAQLPLPPLPFNLSNLGLSLPSLPSIGSAIDGVLPDFDAATDQLDKWFNDTKNAARSHLQAAMVIEKRCSLRPPDFVGYDQQQQLPHCSPL